MTTYGPRVNVHPDRYGAVKSGPNRLLVLHTSEGGETTGSAEALGRFMEQPGDRFNGSTGNWYGASYQYITDTDRVLPATPDGVVSYSAAGANHDGIHICFPGKANQTRAQWLDANSLAMLHQCADVMRDKSLEHGIPLTRLTDAEIRAGKRGYCDHWAISRVYGKSDHTDVGSGFPWDVLTDLLTDDPPGGPTVAERLVFKDYRLYDSRERDGKLGSDDRQIIVTDPAANGAVALQCNITIDDTEGSGFMSAWKGGAAWPGTSKLNWTGPRQADANEVTVELGPFGTFNVKAGGTPDAKTHFVVDVVGYWMP